MEKKKMHNFLRRIMPLFVVCLVLISCVIPANGAGIRNHMGITSGWYRGLTSAQMSVYPIPGDGTTGRGFEFDIFVEDDYGILDQSGYKIYEISSESLYANNTEYASDYSLSQYRKSLVLNGARYWYARTKMNLLSSGTNDMFIMSDGFKFTFDPFAMEYNQAVFARMFEYHCVVPTRITVSATYVTSVTYIPFTYKYDVHYTGGSVWENPLTRLSQVLADRLDPGDPILFSDITIDIQNYTTTAYTNHLYATSIEYGILTQQYSDDSQLEKLLGNYSIGDFWYDAYPTTSSGGGKDTPTELAGGFLGFVTSSVASFFDVELMPGFSLGGVLAIIATVCVILIILKFFGGG